MTTERFIETMKNETTAITFVINCMGEQESFTKDEIRKMIRIWGSEEVERYFMINTKEMMIIIK